MAHVCVCISSCNSKIILLPYFSIPVTVDNVAKLAPLLPETEDPYQTTYYVNILTARGAASPSPNVTTLTSTFTIEAEYCKPGHATEINTLLILTHGFGFDRSYLDFRLPSNDTDHSYSFIHAATGAGYSTLSWNRLGITPSSLADLYTQIQPAVQLSLLISLTKLPSSGGITGLARPQRVIQVSHSFGSQLTNALAADAPDLTHGIIPTGYLHRNDFGNMLVASTAFELASTNNAQRFPRAQYSGGLLTWPSQSSNQYAFFAFPQFDPEVLRYAESIKRLFTIAELLYGWLFH